MKIRVCVQGEGFKEVLFSLSFVLEWNFTQVLIMGGFYFLLFRLLGESLAYFQTQKQSHR